MIGPTSASRCCRARCSPIETALTPRPRPESVIIGKWSQPAAVTAVQRQAIGDDVAAGGEVALGQRRDLLLAEPLTTVSRSRRGSRSAVVSTAATNGVLQPARPRFRPSARRRDGIVDLNPALELRLAASRSAIAAISFCFISQAVGCRVPSRRASSTDDISSLLWLRWSRRNQVASGSWSSGTRSRQSARPGACSGCAGRSPGPSVRHSPVSQPGQPACPRQREQRRPALRLGREALTNSASLRSFTRRRSPLSRPSSDSATPKTAPARLC